MKGLTPEDAQKLVAIKAEFAELIEKLEEEAHDNRTGRMLTLQFKTKEAALKKAEEVIESLEAIAAAEKEAQHQQLLEEIRYTRGIPQKFRG